MDRSVVNLWACAALAFMQAAPAHGEDISAPRLTGLVIGPQAREAVLSDGKDRRTIVVPDGAAFGGYVLRIVDSETVELVGLSGVLTLLIGSGSKPLPALPKAETNNAGASVGLLAMDRDDCARAGLLPGVRPDTETRLRALIVAVAKLAGRPDGEINRLAPSKFNAAGMSAGLAANRGKPAGFTSDRAECAGLEARWRRVAGRWGLL